MNGGLERRIGLFGLTASGVGMILGAGIYALIGRAAGLAGNSVWISFVLGAFISSFTGLSYAELASMIPRAAAEVFYAREAFKGEMAPFLIGWIIIFTETVSAATVALGFGGYFNGLFGTPTDLVSIALIVLMSLINLAGIEESSRLNVVFTLIEAGGLLTVVILGIPHLGRGDYLEASRGFQGILKASALIFFAYLGFQDIVNLAEESKHPERDVPNALILSVVVTAILYALVGVSAVSLADWRELGLSKSPLAYAVSKSLGEGAFLAMSGIALFATSNTVLILLIVTSRMIYGMAESGYLPTVFSRISKRGAPRTAVLATMIVSSLFVLLGNIEFVAEVTNLGTFITFASVNLSAILLRIKKPEWKRPFKTPGIVSSIPIIPLLGLLSCGIMVTQLRLEVIALSFLIIIIGIPLKTALQKIGVS